MQKEMVVNANETVHRQDGHRPASPLERIFNRDVGGMPVALIACALAAVIFGGLIAMSAGGH